MSENDGEFSFKPTPLTAQSSVTDASTGITRPIQKQQQQVPKEAVARTKVALAAGYSQMGWMTKCQRNKQLGIGDRGFNPAMTKEEVAKHKTVEDAWIIIRRKVYNMTPYLEYHPGGIDILKSALGKDATLLFDKYHPWVNVDAMLQACWLGVIRQ